VQEAAAGKGGGGGDAGARVGGGEEFGRSAQKRKHPQDEPEARMGPGLLRSDTNLSFHAQVHNFCTCFTNTKVQILTQKAPLRFTNTKVQILTQKASLSPLY